VDRVVLDTVVFVRALINPHSRSGRLLSDYAERYVLLISKPTAEEILEVIQRPELKRKFSHLGRLNTRRVIDLVAQAQFVEIGLVPPVVRDPEDDIIVATAIAGQANFIVSEDNDLLDLKQVAGIPIIDTQTFLARLESPAGETQ
jgi:putative PIN family toxin of toxin-antitoxin system